MTDALRITVALIGGYAAFMGLIVLLIKAFFPFFTKEQLAQQKLARNH